MGGRGGASAWGERRLPPPEPLCILQRPLSVEASVAQRAEDRESSGLGLRKKNLVGDVRQSARKNLF